MLENVFAALKVVFDVAVYRLGKLEMANMFAAVAIMFALRLSWADAVVRIGFGLLLNLLAYLTNDYYDVEQDLASPNKDRRKSEYLAGHMKQAAAAQIVLALLLVGVALAWSPGLLVPLVLGGGICWIYSWKLKRYPYIDVVSMILWGVAMPMVGFPLDSTLGWALVGQLALFSACFESIQVIRDHDEDVASGVRTTAVRMGVPATRALLVFFMLVSAAYSVLLLHRWIGLALLVAPLIPFDRERTDRYWNRQRLVMGLVWLALIGWAFWFQGSHGWLLQVASDAVVDWP
ncbi:MAG: UbiA family prenyltransferase [Polyangia bacterium]